MTASSYASDAKITEALAVLGADLIGQTEQTLLQQLVVAAALGGGGGGGGAATWGTITGTLSAQTDLQSALDAKLNLTGGTLTGALLLANGSAAAPGLMFTATAGNLIGFYGTSSSLIFSAYGSPQFAFATGFNGSAFALQRNGNIEWSSTSNPDEVPNIFLKSGGAATLQMGTNHATTATNQTFKAHDVTAGVGADLILKGGSGSLADGYVKIGASTGGLAFFGAGGSLLISGNTSTNISSAGAGNPLLDDTQSDGGLAGGAYTFGGLVAALKSYGIIG